MLRFSKNNLAGNKIFQNGFLKNSGKRLIASRRHNTYFDIQVDWYMKFAGSKHMSFSRFLAIINIGLFLYANVRYGWQNRWKALEEVSYSFRNFQNKDYSNIVSSLLGSYKPEDLALETGILLTVGHSMERLYGRPFMFKMFIFSFYIGYLSSLYWVRSNLAKRERYHVEEPLQRDYGTPNSQNYRFMSAHGFCMSLVYFAMFKNPKLRMLILPVVAADLYIWGPYYSPGALTGIAAGMIL
jgi:hypothetical protein